MTPGFFETYRIRFLAGRTFSEAEMQPDSPAVIVSENVAKRYWPGQDPIGKRIKAGAADSQNPWMNIVGVVNEMKYRGLPNNPTADPDIFAPLNAGARNFMLTVRTSLDPASLTPSISFALIGVVVGEFLGGESGGGLGYLIIQSLGTLNAADMMVALIALGVIGITMALGKVTPARAAPMQ